MMRSFLAVVSVALLAATAGAQYTPFALPAGNQTCAGGVCRPVAAVTGAVHSAVVAGGATLRAYAPAPAVSAAPCRPAAVTYTPGQPVRNLGRAVRQLLGR